METSLQLTDILLLLFWVRLWSLPDQELYFNPLLSAPTRLTDRVLDFLRPVLPIPGRLTALLLLVFFLLFRAVLLQQFRADEPWMITIGTILQFSPRDSEISGAMMFSTLHFLFFVARYWGVYLLIQLLTPVPRRNRATEAFAFVAFPLAALRRWAQLLLLLIVHAVLVYELSRAGTLNLPPSPETHLLLTKFAAGTAASRLLPLGCLCLFSVADSLMLAWQLMFALLVVSFFAAMLQNAALVAISNESVATMLGGWQQRLVVGFLDLTPLLYMASVYLLYNIVLLPSLFTIATKIQ